MNDEWTKLIASAALSAIGVFVWGMMQDIKELRDTQAEGKVQIHRLDVIEGKVARVLQEFDLKLKKDSIEK